MTQVTYHINNIMVCFFNTTLPPPPVDIATRRSVLCRWVDVTIPPLSFSIYRNKLVIGQFIKHSPAGRSLIVCRICVSTDGWKPG